MKKDKIDAIAKEIANESIATGYEIQYLINEPSRRGAIVRGLNDKRLNHSKALVKIAQTAEWYKRQAN